MLDLFKRNSAGQIIELENSFIVLPGRENGLKMLFGGEVLKSMDELSGTLANYFLAIPHWQAVHAGEIVYFEKPLLAGESGKIIARVMLVCEKIICVYIAVFGGPMQKPDEFTLRYEGFGLCAVLDTSRAPQIHTVHTLSPYEDMEHPQIVAIARDAVEFQKRTLRALKASREKT